MSQQLDRIELSGQTSVKKRENPKDDPLDPKRPIFKYELDKELKDFKLGKSTNISEDLITRLEKLSLQNNNPSPSGTKLNVLHYEDENTLNKIKYNNPKPKTRNYYPRPSFADVQFEERVNFVENSYTADGIVEWNIDGASEQHILDVIQQMTMAATSYKTKAGNTDKKIALAITMGFTGQLKGWWDNIITEQQRNAIFDVVKIENEMPYEDAVTVGNRE